MDNPHDRSRSRLIVLAGAILIALIVDAFVLIRYFKYFSKSSFDSPLYMLLTWAVGWLTATALVTFFIFQLLKYQKPLLAQAICLIAVTVNLILIFSICPMDLLAKPKGFEDHPPSIAPDSTAETFLIEEHKKAVEEIKNRDLEEDSWFHNKFILVGGLLAATMGYIGFGVPQSPQESPGERLTTLSKSPSTAVILALASVLAFGIDLHVRANTCETDQLGLWIRYYVEPVAFHAKPEKDVSQSFLTNFCGWEEFLRESAPPRTKTVDWKHSAGAALHSDELQSLFYDPHIYFLTVFVYVLYLAVFQTSFFAFAWIAHSAPQMFEMKVLPFLLAYEAGYYVPLHYFVPCLALVILNIPYLCLLSPKWIQSSGKQASTSPELSHSSS